MFCLGCGNLQQAIVLPIDGLSSRDLVHRQTACAAIKHMAIGVFGFGCEDALGHLVNNVWPNIFETSPHVVNAFTEAVEGLRVGCGSAKVLQYTLQVILLLSSICSFHFQHLFFSSYVF